MFRLRKQRGLTGKGRGGNCGRVQSGRRGAEKRRRDEIVLSCLLKADAPPLEPIAVSSLHTDLLMDMHGHGCPLQRPGMITLRWRLQ